MDDMPAVKKSTPKEPSKLRLEAHYDSFGGQDDKYAKERKQRNAAKRKAITQELKNLKPEAAYKLAKASLEKELRRCEMEAMEYEDEPTIDEAYDEKD